MKAYLDFVDEFRVGSFFDELVPEEYKNEMARLMEETVNAEEELLKTFSEEQLEHYEKLDDCIYNYVEVLEKSAFFRGFELSKKIFGSK